jgi:hypothetical protein
MAGTRASPRRLCVGFIRATEPLFRRTAEFLSSTRNDLREMYRLRSKKRN